MNTSKLVGKSLCRCGHQGSASTDFFFHLITKVSIQTVTVMSGIENSKTSTVLGMDVIANFIFFK